MLTAVGKEYEDGSVGLAQMRMMITRIKHSYSHGKPMLKGEVEFLRYYMLDL